MLAEHGCNVTRSFTYWPDFVPAPERLAPEVLDRFSDFLDAHVEVGLTTIPTFIVGHMSGQNWDPVWRGGRDLYRDVWMVSQQAWLVEQLARRFGGHAAVSGWLLTNEMPLYGGHGDVLDVTAWARLLINALRAGGAHQPVSIGDGAWGIEMSGHDNGFSLRRLAPLLDFLGPHVYPMSDDPVRQHTAAALTCELARSFGLPVVLEEFGVSSDFVSDHNAADYYRQVLHSSLLAGAQGWLAWNNCDYDALSDQDPYRHHGFEMHFGLTDLTGKPKAQLAEVARFARLLGALPLGRRQPAAAEVALVLPEHFERDLPFTSDHDRADIRDHALQAYIACKEADLPVGIAREVDGFDGGHKLYLMPSAKLITAPGMSALAERASAGALVYASYFPGSTNNQRGAWLPWLEDLFGVHHQLRYGVVQPLDDDELILEMVEAFGDLGIGDTLRFQVAGNASARTFLPVEPTGAEVLAVDRAGRPALLRNLRGSGSMVLCTYPIEHMAARTPWVNPEQTWRLYSALAVAATVARPIRCSDPLVMVGRLDADGTELVLVLNASSDAVHAALVVEEGHEYRVFDFSGASGAGGVTAVSLEPYEVAVLSATTTHK